MNLQSSIKIIDNEGTILLDNLLGLNEPITKKESYSGIVLDSGASKTINFIGLEYAKGVLLASDNRIKVECADGNITGDKILINQVDGSNLKITNISKEYDVGTIDSVEDNKTLKVKDKNYTYSKLVGTPVYGPFNLSGSAYLFTMYGHTTIKFYLPSPIVGEGVEETGADIADALQTAINDIVNYSAVTVEYNTDKQFIITAQQSGAHEMSFDEANGSNELFIGMANPQLIVGGEDYAGKKIKILSGSGATGSYTIDSIAGNEIKTMEVMDPIPAANDYYKIYDEVKTTVNILVYL